MDVLVLAASGLYIQETRQEMRYPNVTSLYFATHLAFNTLRERFPCDYLHKILHGGQRMDGTKWRRNIPESFNPRVGCTNVTG